MTTALLLGFLSGLDNLRVGCAVGCLGLDARRSVLLAGSFGVFEALMPLIGASFSHRWLASTAAWGSALEMALLAACGACVLAGVLRGVDVAGAMARSRLVFVLPALLSVDNLLAGATLSTASSTTALPALLTIGAVSCGLSLLGFVVGARLTAGLSARAAVAGTALMVAAALAAF